jgi:amino acid transporter
MTADTFLFNAGWLFFAAYTIVVAGVTVAAFGRSLFPSKAQNDPTQAPPTADLSRSSDPRAR